MKRTEKRRRSKREKGETVMNSKVKKNENWRVNLGEIKENVNKNKGRRIIRKRKNGSFRLGKNC